MLGKGIQFGEVKERITELTAFISAGGDGPGQETRKEGHSKQREQRLQSS